MSKYDEIMNKIELTDERRERILKGIQSKLEPEYGADAPKKGGITRIISVLMPVAAAAAVMLLALLIWKGSPLRPGVKPPVPTSPPITGTVETPTPTQGGETQDWTIYEDVVSLQELEQIYGYSIKTLPYLPFESNGVRYVRYGSRPMIAYLGESLGDIDYDDVEDFRELSLFQVKEEKNRIIIDTEYAVDETIEIAGASVHIRGEEEGIQVMEWYDGEFYYLIIDDGFLSRDDAIETVTHFLQQMP